MKNEQEDSGRDGCPGRCDGVAQYYGERTACPPAQPGVLKGMLANLEGIEEIEALFAELKGTIVTVLESYLTPGGMMQGN